jgi:hypothetical protein
MGAPVVIRQRAADINSGVNSRDECRNATSPVGTTEGNIIGSIVVGALVAWRLLVPILSLAYMSPCALITVQSDPVRRL